MVTAAAKLPRCPIARSAWLRSAVAGAVLAVAGCGGPSHLEAVQNCASLEGAKSSDTGPLRDAIDQLERAGQTPLLLIPTQPTDPTQNAAAVLSGALTDESRLRLVPLLAGLIPDGRFAMSQLELAQAREVIGSLGPLRKQIGAAEAAPECVFDVRFDLGFFGGMRFLDDVAIACRLHLLAMAAALEDSEIAVACDEIEAALWWVDHLAKINRIESRLRAAQLRGECLLAVETMAGGAPLQQADVERLYGIMRRSLDSWPDESAPLVGDRAMTLHAYEAVRAGMFDKIATAEERALLEQRGDLERMQNLDAARVDRDELSYLQAMEELIRIAPRPFHERAQRVENLLARFDPDGPEARPAPLAAHLFLPGLEHAIREIATDRAVAEAWALALAAAGELDLPPYRVNPVTGVEYSIDRLAGVLVVRLHDPEVRDAVARPLR